MPWKRRGGGMYYFRWSKRAGGKRRLVYVGGSLLGVCAAIADARDREERAAARRERLPAPLSPLHERAVTELLAGALTALGEAGYTTAWQKGQEGGEASLERLA